jgi:hypothetical protein
MMGRSDQTPDTEIGTSQLRSALADLGAVPGNRPEIKVCRPSHRRTGSHVTVLVVETLSWIIRRRGPCI